MALLEGGVELEADFKFSKDLHHLIHNCDSGCELSDIAQVSTLWRRSPAMMVIDPNYLKLLSLKLNVFLCKLPWSCCFIANNHKTKTDPLNVLMLKTEV